MGRTPPSRTSEQPPSASSCRRPGGLTPSSEVRGRRRCRPGTFPGRALRTGQLEARSALPSATSGTWGRGWGNRTPETVSWAPPGSSAHRQDQALPGVPTTRASSASLALHALSFPSYQFALPVAKGVWLDLLWRSGRRCNLAGHHIPTGSQQASTGRTLPKPRWSRRSVGDDLHGVILGCQWPAGRTVGLRWRRGARTRTRR